MGSLLPHPPYDPELGAILAKLTPTPSLTPADIPRVRRFYTPTLTDVLAGLPISHEEHIVGGPDGDGLTLSVFRRAVPGLPGDGPRHLCPGIYFTHGGGMFAGNRFFFDVALLEYVTRFDAVLVSVEYRLPPEHPDPAPVEDCYAGLVSTAAHAADLGIDPARLMIAGMSAGGGLAAGTALLARDRGGPALCAQLLICPMLDDRGGTVSSQQYMDGGTWSRGNNEMGWTCLLGERRGGEDVSIYAAPSRALDLAGLPTTYIDVGSAEVFRDEVVAYATTLWQCGVQTELHVWPGGFHGFDMLAPKATLSLAARQARLGWMQRILGVAQDSAS